MNKPRLSFIIPLYNESEVFSELIMRLNKLIDEIDGVCEVVLIDDGSTDNTQFFMQELATKNSIYQCVFLTRNFGQQNALSAGLDFARGEYIMFLDADLQD